MKLTVFSIKNIFLHTIIWFCVFRSSQKSNLPISFSQELWLKVFIFASIQISTNCINCLSSSVAKNSHVNSYWYINSFPLPNKIIKNKGNKLKDKIKKYHTVSTVPKFNRKIVERDKFDNTKTHIHDCSISLISTCTSKKVAVLD